MIMDAPYGGSEGRMVSNQDPFMMAHVRYLHLQSNEYGFMDFWMPLMEEAKEEGVLCTFAKTTQVPRSITIKFTLGTYSQKRLHFCVHKPPVAFYLYKGQE